jgi:DNA-directed RNA polymerase specialized sigma24 family protein
VTLSSEEIAQIYEAASSLLPAARAFARRVMIAPHVAEDLLMEAAVQIIEHRQKQKLNRVIEHLPSYILTTYKHLLFKQTKKTKREQNLTDEGWELLLERTDSSREILRMILIDEVINHMNERMRFVFEKRLFGYSFEEIAPMYQDAFGQRMDANVLRSKYSKTIDKLSRKLSDK